MDIAVPHFFPFLSSLDGDRTGLRGEETGLCGLRGHQPPQEVLDGAGARINQHGDW